MKLPINEIERFFETKFETISPGPGRALHHFDGCMHWHVVYDDIDCFFITADRELSPGPFPVLEIAVYSSRVSTSYAVDVGPVLILHPKNTDETRHCVVLTRTKDGRLSLSTSVGAVSDGQEPKPSPVPKGGPATASGDLRVTGGRRP